MLGEINILEHIPLKLFENILHKRLNVKIYLNRMSKLFDNVLCRLVRNVLKMRGFRKEVSRGRIFNNECKGEKTIDGF